MSETAVLEEPNVHQGKTAGRPRDAMGRLLPNAPYSGTPLAERKSIFDIELIQKIIDEAQRNLDLPAVEMGQGVFQPMDSDRKSPDYKRPDGTMAEGGICPQRCCELDEKGLVVPFSGAVVTPELLEEFQRRVISKLETIMLRTHAQMVRGGSQGDGKYIVHNRDKVMRFMPQDDF